MRKEQKKTCTENKVERIKIKCVDEVGREREREERDNQVRAGSLCPILFLSAKFKNLLKSTSRTGFVNTNEATGERKKKKKKK